ncbi:MAG TPA: hypothetical protein VFB21_20565 [Chthonomonadaceae bacterium]|nr:hypothetical protein [Chthonomonadaceae bacterium]
MARKPKTPPAEDARIARLEAEREAPLTQEQRERLPNRLQGLPGKESRLRQYPLADGGDAPCFLFPPMRRERKAGKGKRADG